MPKLDCPLDNFTTESEDTPTAAKELADHLIKMHAKTPFPVDRSVLDADLVDGIVGGTEARSRVEAGPAKADVETKRQ